jgi:hypothetical protein
LNGRHPFRKPGLDRDAILGDCASRQQNDLVDRFIKIKAIHFHRYFLDVITDPLDNVSSTIGIVHDTAVRFPDLPQVWRLSV